MFLPFSRGSYEPFIIIYILILIWSNDSFAYLVGKNFGKRKLFESVSPNKTIEGFLGGILFTIVAAVVVSYYSDLFSRIHWIILSVMVSVLGTVGDLVESKFKREAKIKDSGNIMPGHGGMFDRLDSLLFIAPFVYLYIYFLN
jgi:phosphatidate cytidylyltransferase